LISLVPICLQLSRKTPGSDRLSAFIRHIELAPAPRRISEVLRIFNNLLESPANGTPPAITAIGNETSGPVLSTGVSIAHPLRMIRSKQQQASPRLNVLKRN